MLFLNYPVVITKYSITQNIAPVLKRYFICWISCVMVDFIGLEDRGGEEGKYEAVLLVSCSANNTSRPT